MPDTQMERVVLLVSCPDRKGITATVTDFVYKNGGNILHADQHIDDKINIFFMRIEWSLDGFRLSKNQTREEFAKIAENYGMDWRIAFSGVRPKAAIFVSKPLHCLYDLLYRHKSGQLNCAVSLVVSNHPDAGELAEYYGVPFEHFHITSHNRALQESKQLERLQHHQVDLIVLARYHQILSKAFVDQFPDKIINIHHSFLPAFIGKNPYAQAYTKGVKIIGATSHYVTESLDEGPIIEQDTVRVSHRDSLEDLKQKGEDLERVVLFRAMRWHLEHKILRYKNKTVVFD